MTLLSAAKLSPCRPRPSDALDIVRVAGELGAAHSCLHIAQPTTQGSPPQARFNHGAALLGVADVAVFGGCGGVDGKRLLADVGLLEMKRMRWTVLETRGIPPAPRSGLASASLRHEGRLFLFGGAAQVTGSHGHMVT